MRNIFIITTAISAILLYGCQNFLEEAPQGVVSDSDLNTPENIEKMVISAYSALGNEAQVTSNSLWQMGSIRSGDAHKGGDGLGDYIAWHDYETFVTNRPDNESTNNMWIQWYIAVGRINDALRRVNQAEESAYPQKTGRQAELRFLRAHFYFMLKIVYKYIPYIDETIPKEQYETISNREYSSDELWTKIADDLRFSADNLPGSQTDRGRPDKFAAKAYLAKTLLYQAYTQDEQHQVTGIDQGKLNEVNNLCAELLGSNYSLFDDFGKNFLSQYENGVESVFAVQYSHDDGTPLGRFDMGHAVNFTMNPEFGCCGFHVPTQNMINAFKTGADGLPMFSDYDKTEAREGSDFQIQSFDPRLDHTIAIPGHPFKYAPDVIFERSWTRAPAIYGAYASMKELVPVGDPSFVKRHPYMSSSKNWAVIRFADILLWKAEALIELGRQEEALPLINRIRERALNSTAMLKRADGLPVSTYRADIYKPGVNCTWTQGFAREALRWERRLEFAMEGYRLFDLIRWGIAADYLNAYFAGESKRKPYLATASFQKGRDEYLPIPLNQVNYSKGLYVQNNKW